MYKAVLHFLLIMQDENWFVNYKSLEFWRLIQLNKTQREGKMTKDNEIFGAYESPQITLCPLGKQDVITTSGQQGEVERPRPSYRGEWDSL